MVTTNQKSHPAIGLGGPQPSLVVYIANRPPLPEFEKLSSYRSMMSGEIKFVADQTGNHWRKVFNVFAKLAFSLNPQGCSTWQILRDQKLLQAGSMYSLLFSEPDFSRPIIHVVMGKGYAERLCLHDRLSWIDDSFAISERDRLIVCPYFDYRQLSNLKIDELSRLIQCRY